MAQVGAAALQPLTCAGYALPGGAPSFEPLSATGESEASSLGHSQFTDLQALTASGDSSAGSAAAAAISLEALTAAGKTPVVVALSLEALACAGTGKTGGVASAEALFRPLEALGVTGGGSIARGTSVFQPLSSDGTGDGPRVGVGAASLRRLRAQGTSLVGTVAAGAPSLQPLDITAAGYEPSVGLGAARLLPLRAYGASQQAITASYRTWVINVSNDALTEYQNYDFDALAEFSGAQYGAGPAGIFRLAGDDDQGEAIAWSFRTGLMDGKDEMLKRLEEVLFSARFDGPMRLRVWTDDAAYFDYNVANHRPDVVHQVRAKLGKGAKSRFFRVELSAMGTTAAEVHAMQLPMIPTKRRLG